MSVLKADLSNAVEFARNESMSGLLESLGCWDFPNSASYKPFALAELDRRGLAHRVPARTRRNVEAGLVYRPEGWVQP